MCCVILLLLQMIHPCYPSVNMQPSGTNNPSVLWEELYPALCLTSGNPCCGRSFTLPSIWPQAIRVVGGALPCPLFDLRQSVLWEELYPALCLTSGNPRCGRSFTLPSVWPQAIRESAFGLGGSLSAPPRGFKLNVDVTVSLGFRTLQNGGVLLTTSQGVHLLLLNRTLSPGKLNKQNSVHRNMMELEHLLEQQRRNLLLTWPI